MKREPNKYIIIKINKIWIIIFSYFFQKWGKDLGNACPLPDKAGPWDDEGNIANSESVLYMCKIHSLIFVSNLYNTILDI